MTDPVAAPPFAESPASSVNLAPAAQEEKSVVTVAVVDPFGARLPKDKGKEPLTSGVQAGPPVWRSVKPVSSAAFAAPGPLLITLKAHWRAFDGPDLPVIAPPNVVAKGEKFAVTVCAEFMVIVVEALFGPATLPVQSTNA